MAFDPVFNTAPGAVFGRQPNYASMLQGGLGGIGDQLNKNRDYAAGLADTKARLALAGQSLDYRKSQDEISNKLAQDTFDLNKRKEDWDEAHPPAPPTPSAWVVNPDGSMTPRKDGPADPEYQRKVAAAKAKTPGTKPLPLGMDKMLDSAGQDLISINRQTSKWKPEYGHHLMMGDIGNDLAAKGLPSLGSSSKEQALWWSDYYANTKAIKRNRLYGAALTPQEREDFDRSDINPTMDPDVIKANLVRQHDILLGAAQRTAAGLIAEGTNPKAVQAKLGVNLADLGIKIDPKTGEILEMPNVPGLQPIDDGSAPDDTMHL